MGKKIYDEKSIESLSPLEFTRLRPNVYCGNTEYSTQLLIEILSNSIDEFNLGHGDKIEIEITHDKDGKNPMIMVRDYGQGFIPNLMREDGKTVLEAAFSVLNTSGKFKEDGTYEGTSLGSFGIGSKITTYLSHKLTVLSYRDKKSEKVEFIEGEFNKRELGTVLNNIHGTTVMWTPSEEFFDNPDVDLKVIKDLLRTTVCLCRGLTIVLNVDGKQTTYVSERGLNDLVDLDVGDKEILKNRFEVNFMEGKNIMHFVLTYTSNFSSKIVPYVNTGLTEAGPHISQIKSTITREFNKFFRDKKWIKDKEENLTGDDLQEGLYIVFNLTAPNVTYDAQVKSRVTSIDMKPFLTNFTDRLQKWLAANEKEVKGIAEKTLQARKAREAAKKARDAVRKIIKDKPTSNLRSKMAISEKFIACTEKNPKNRSLLLVEGNSAAASAVEARDAKRDAIYMLRGKTISPLKTTVEKILANQEMSDIIKVLGAGFGDDFKESDMQFDKVVITSDADADGYDIELLLITFFFTYMRPLVESGHLYRAVTPLFIVKDKKEEIFCYTNEEYEEVMKKHPNGEVTRLKGLGEISAETLHAVCFDRQNYRRITISDAEAATELLNVLQGPSAELRKQYIYNNAKELGFHFL